MKKVLDLQTHVLNHKIFKHELASIVATEKMMMKNSSETLLQQDYIKKEVDNLGTIFHIKTLSETISDGSATKKLSTDMNALIKELSVGTDASGNLQTIYNMPEIKEKWQQIKKKWKKEATKETKVQVQKTIATVEENIANGSFVKEIAQQGALHFLLPGLYKDFTEDVVIEKNLSKFLVTQPLPLNISYAFVEDKTTRNVVIEGTGVLAEDKLDKKTLTKLIRTLKDRIDLKVALQIDYKERFEFDQYHWLTKAKQQVKVKIPGFYMAESKQEITETQSHE